MVDKKRYRKIDDDLKSASPVNEEISRQLKALYQEVESEAIPDRFLDLLEQLDQAEKSQTGGSAK